MEADGGSAVCKKTCGSGSPFYAIDQHVENKKEDCV